MAYRIYLTDDDRFLLDVGGKRCSRYDADAYPRQPRCCGARRNTFREART